MVKPCPRAINSVERFHRQILGNRGVPDNPNDPAVNFAVGLPEHRLKGVKIAPGKTLEEVCGHGFVSSPTILGTGTEWFSK